MPNILSVDLTTGAVSVSAVSGDLAGLGGRGLTSALVAAQVDPKTDPLGPDNLLVFAGGILAGTTFPNGGRLSVGAKSPLTGGIKEANAGGEAARKLAHLDLRAIALSGVAAELSLIEIDVAGARVKAAPQLAGLGSYETVEKLRATYGDDPTFVCCGPAGERQLKAAAVITTTPDFHLRTASRGGLGAVMGSKKIKAIVINAKGATRPRAADAGKMKAAATAFSAGLRADGFIGGLGTLGTALLVNVANSIGCMPTKGFSAGAFDQAAAISGERLAEIQAGRPNSQMSHRCMTGCVVSCSQIYTDEQGKTVTSGFEYESLVLLGSNCRISDLDQLAKLDRLCDDLGVDTIELGAALGVAMEGGMLAWGDGPGAYDLLEGIRRGNDQSLLIGNGCVAVGEALGVARIPAVKGQGIPAWEPRVLKATGATYATSPQGADHTCGNVLPSADYDASAAGGQAAVSRSAQYWLAAVDTMGLCLMPAFVAGPEMQGHLRAACAAVLGEELPDDYLTDLGVRVISIERDFNRRVGFTPADDRLPAFMTTEPLPPTGHVFDVSDADLDGLFA